MTRRISTEIEAMTRTAETAGGTYTDEA